MLSTRDPLQTQGHIRTEMRSQKKIFYANENQKKMGVAILISDKIDFKIKTVIRDEEGQYIMIKGSIQADIAIINICIQHRSTLIHMENAKNHKRGITIDTIIVGDFNTPLISMNRSSKQKIKKETQALSQFYLLEDLQDNPSKNGRLHIFSQVHTEHSPGQITSWVTNQALVNLRKWKLYQAFFSDHNAIRLDINYKGKKKSKLVQNTDTWRPDNVLLNSQEVAEEIKVEIKKYPETNDNENTTTQNL